MPETGPGPGPVSIISSDMRERLGAFAATRRLLNEVRLSKDQIASVYRQNFRVSAFGSGLGVAWNYILPLVPVTLYLFLATIRVFPSFDGVNGAIYITFGVTVWYVLAGFVLEPVSVVNSRNKEAMKTSLPLIASVAASFAQLAFDTLIRVAFVLVIILVSGVIPKLTSPALLLILFAAFLLFFGIGLVMSILNVIYKDVARVLEIVLRYGIFLSGVIFPLGDSAAAVMFGQLNPFAVFVESCRQIVFQGSLEQAILMPLLVWSSLGVIVFLIGCRIFYVMEYRIRSIH